MTSRGRGGPSTGMLSSSSLSHFADSSSFLPRMSAEAKRSSAMREGFSGKGTII